MIDRYICKISWLEKYISLECIKIFVFFLFDDYYGFELLWSPIRLHFNLFSFRKSCFKANLKTNYRNKQNIVLNIVSIVMSFQWTKKRVKRKIKILCYHCDFVKHTKVRSFFLVVWISHHLYRGLELVQRLIDVGKKVREENEN